MFVHIVFERPLLEIANYLAVTLSVCMDNKSHNSALTDQDNNVFNNSDRDSLSFPVEHRHPQQSRLCCRCAFHQKVSKTAAIIIFLLIAVVVFFIFFVIAEPSKYLR